MFEVSVHVWMRLHDTDYKNVVNCPYEKIIDSEEEITTEKFRGFGGRGKGDKCKLCRGFLIIILLKEKIAE